MLKLVGTKEGGAVNRLMKIIKKYWIDENTNIFKNYKDALAGLLALIIIPALSIGFTTHIDKPTFWNYAFPLLSISLAGLYDTYNRYEVRSPKNTKLLIRTIFNFTSIFFSAISIGSKSIILPYISPILLFVCGLLLIFEIYSRVKMAILISPWNVY